MLCEIQTPSSKNYCGFYANAIILASKPKNIRNQTYANLGLTNETARAFYQQKITPNIEKYQAIIAEREKLDTDNAKALEKIIEYQKFTIFGSFETQYHDQYIAQITQDMSDPAKKKKHLDELPL